MRRNPDGSAEGRGDAEAVLRLFFALWPDAAARDALGTLALAVAAQARGKSPPAENLHLTVVFLGDIPATRVDALRSMGAREAAIEAPFALTLDRMGTFRGTGIAWVGPSSPPPRLDPFARRLGAALAADGFATERQTFHPHVTLARRCRKPGNATIASPIAWHAARLTLTASDPRADGPRYRDIDAWPLDGGESGAPRS